MKYKRKFWDFLEHGDQLIKTGRVLDTDEEIINVSHAVCFYPGIITKEQTLMLFFFSALSKMRKPSVEAKRPQKES